MTLSLLTSKEVAKQIGCSKITIERLQKAGKIPFVRIGRLVRYSRDAIDRWIESGGTNQPEQSTKIVWDVIKGNK